MLYEIEYIPANLTLHKWYLIRELNGVRPSSLYVSFITVIDLDGKEIFALVKGAHVFVEMQFSPNGTM